MRNWEKYITLTIKKLFLELSNGTLKYIKEIKELRKKLKNITPDSLHYLRNFGNDFIVDVLLFLSPKYAQKIINIVAKQMNDRYVAFLDAYPNSNKKIKVSVIGHSLGSIILWDLLIHQNNCNMNLLAGTKLTYPKLNFEVENFFAFGSPIGIFLTVRFGKN